MKVVVFGSTGGTGRLLVEQALALGHEVTAFARIPAKILIHHQHLTVLQGDVLDPAKVDLALRGNEVVLSALGTGLGGPGNVVSNGIKNILTAMERFGTERLVVESAYGVGDSYSDARLSVRLVARTLLKRIYADKEVEDRYIRESKVEWVVCRPPALTNGPAKGVYRVGEHLRLGITDRISRADVADFMLKQLFEDNWLYKFPVLAY